jgi:hypothetical protein
MEVLCEYAPLLVYHELRSDMEVIDMIPSFRLALARSSISALSLHSHMVVGLGWVNDSVISMAW